MKFANCKEKKEFESLVHIVKTSTGIMKDMVLKDKRYLELKEIFANCEDLEGGK